MGNFFTSTQIYNTNQLDREQFISFFCEEMKKNGYVPGNSDESEVSYIFRFADDCKWVTITSENHDEGNQLSQTDTSRLAKMLKTTCINTTVIDSDHAVMEMYNKSGQKADTLIMGRADDYFGDEIPQPSMKAWKPFLAEGRSWEQFCDIVQESESYTFIEDGLSELATVIGMDESEILFHASVAEEDEQTVFLYFTKAAAKEKKLTLKAAFIKVFGEALEPLGFVKAKSKYPYYVRVLNDEILHVITFRKDSFYKNRYDIYAGIATVYRPLLDFDRDPDFNTKWMSPIMAFEDYKVESPVLGICYEYDLNSQTTLIQTLSKSLKHTQEYVLPVLDAVSDLQRVIDFYAIYNSAALYIYSAKDMSEYNRDDNEGFLYILINDHSDMRSEYEKSLERDKYLTENGLSNFDFERLREVAEESRKEKLMNRDAIYNDKKLYEKVIQELSHNKETNIKRLIKYGFNISS